MGDHRQLPPSLPSHLVDVLNFGDSAQNHGGDNSGKLCFFASIGKLSFSTSVCL